MHRSFVHLELNVDDTAEAKAFYRELFGWEVVDIPVGEVAYTQIKPPSGPAGGIQTRLNAEAPSAWVPYVGVPSVRESLRKAEKAGGRVVVDYTEVPGNGALAIICDPGGAWIGLWEVTEPEPPEDEELDEAEEEPVVIEEEPVTKRARPKAVKKKASAALAPVPEETSKPAKKVGKGRAKKAAATEPTPVEPQKDESTEPLGAKRSAKEAGKKTAAKKTGKKSASESNKQPTAKKTGKKSAKKTGKKTGKKPAAKKSGKKTGKKASAKKAPQKKTTKRRR